MPWTVTGTAAECFSWIPSSPAKTVISSIGIDPGPGFDVLGITAPRVVYGISQDTFDGASFTKTLSDTKAKPDKKIQYFEIIGSRAISRGGWIATAFGPRAPWIPGQPKGILEWTAGQGHMGVLQP